MSPLRFKARVGSPLFTFLQGECNVHSLRSTSSATYADLLVANSAASHFPTCIRRGDLTQIWMGNHPDRRRMHCHCASDSTLSILLVYNIAVFAFHLCNSNKTFWVLVGWLAGSSAGIGAPSGGGHFAPSTPQLISQRPSLLWIEGQIL